MSRACVCGGSNENCRFCGGLGTVPNTLGTALEGLQQVAVERVLKGSRKLRSKSGSKKIRTTQKPTRAPESFILVACPECGKSLKAGGLNQHVTVVHGNSPPSQIQKRLNLEKKVREYQACTICNAKIGVDRVEMHMAKVHRNPTTPSPTSHRANPPISKIYGNIFHGFQQESFIIPDSTAPSKSDEGYEYCSICKVRLKVGRLQKHLRKVHKRRPIRAPKVVVQSSKDERSKKTILVTALDKNLDATKPYAHSYRERGRYGSHPSHDAFDDESGPEESR
jgi:hypothetical protein